MVDMHGKTLQDLLKKTLKNSKSKEK